MRVRIATDTHYIDPSTVTLCHVPKTVVVDVGTQQRESALQYRVGMQQTWAPVHENEEGVVSLEATAGAPSMRTCLHVQVGWMGWGWGGK